MKTIREIKEMPQEQKIRELKECDRVMLVAVIQRSGGHFVNKLAQALLVADESNADKIFECWTDMLYGYLLWNEIEARR